MEDEFQAAAALAAAQAAARRGEAAAAAALAKEQRKEKRKHEKHRAHVLSQVACTWRVCMGVCREFFLKRERERGWISVGCLIY
jgi:hypothetical protein